MFSKIGLNGQFVTRLAELDQPPEHEMLNELQLSEERPVPKPLRPKLATPTTAQLTAFKALGVNGPSVTRPVEEDNKPAAEVLLFHLHSEELLALQIQLHKFATRTHAQLTVLCPNGNHGANVTRLVEEEAKPEHVMLKLHPNLKERFVNPALKLKLAMFKNAQLTVLWVNGTHGTLAQRLVEVEVKQDQELLSDNLLSVENYVKPQKKLKFATPMLAQLTV